MKEFDEAGVHPAFGHPPRHDHHRRARRSAALGTILLLLGGVSYYWSTDRYWGDRQRAFAEHAGIAMLACGTMLVLFAAFAFFAFDDDLHADEPE